MLSHLGSGANDRRVALRVVPAEAIGVADGDNGLLFTSIVGNTLEEFLGIGIQPIDLWLDPLRIRFTQCDISKCFRTGLSLDDAIEQAFKGQLDFSNFPAMDCVFFDGKLYSLSNRRLFVARVLRLHGVLAQARVTVLPFSHYSVQRQMHGISKWEQSYSTANDGERVVVSGGSHFEQFQILPPLGSSALNRAVLARLDSSTRPLALAAGTVRCKLLDELAEHFCLSWEVRCSSGYCHVLACRKGNSNQLRYTMLETVHSERSISP